MMCVISKDWVTNALGVVSFERVYCFLLWGEPQLEKGDWEFDAASRMWVKTVFPSRLPAGRQEVQVGCEVEL
jgi:hypothetical protein